MRGSQLTEKSRGATAVMRCCCDSHKLFERPMRQRASHVVSATQEAIVSHGGRSDVKHNVQHSAMLIFHDPPFGRRMEPDGFRRLLPGDKGVDGANLKFDVGCFRHTKRTQTHTPPRCSRDNIWVKNPINVRACDLLSKAVRERRSDDTRHCFPQFVPRHVAISGSEFSQQRHCARKIGVRRENWRQLARKASTIEAPALFNRRANE
mmetsp:Transcript_35762/g.110234  ORF Transcript_35762/g.110234 Transcript_35762/m.110234 type:complete len:207 (-) Transcript_35762:413-1033(-)